MKKWFLCLVCIIIVVFSQFVAVSTVPLAHSSLDASPSGDVKNLGENSNSLYSSSSNEVLVGYIGRIDASLALLYYDPSNYAFRIWYFVKTSGVYDSVKQYVTGIYVWFKLFYTEDGEKDPAGGSPVYDRNGEKVEGKWTYEYTTSVCTDHTFYLSGEPDWTRLRWSFFGVAYGKNWDSVTAKINMQKVENAWKVWQGVSFILSVAGIALLTWEAAGAYAAGESLSIIIGRAVQDQLQDYLLGEIANYFVETAYKNAMKSLNEMAKMEWSTMVIACDCRLKKDLELSFSFTGASYSEDASESWEDKNGEMNYASYYVNVRVSRFKDLQFDFLSVNGSSIVESAYIEGYPGISHGSLTASFDINMDHSHIVKYMKHDENGVPYFEFKIGIIVNPEVKLSEDAIRTWMKKHNNLRYNEIHTFRSTISIHAIDYLETAYSETKEVKTTIYFYLQGTVKEYHVGIGIAVVAAIIIAAVQTVVVVISPPPYTRVKYGLIPPAIPGYDGKVEYVGPQPPPEHIKLDIPEPDWRMVIVMPQLPDGKEWKATLTYDPPDPYDYLQTIYFPDLPEQLNIYLRFPYLDNKEIALCPPKSYNEFLSILDEDAYNMAVIVPKLPEPGYSQTIHLSNPNNIMMLTAQTAYPITVSVPDIEKTTYIKVKSAKKFAFHLIDCNNPSPILPGDPNELGVFLNPGTTSSQFKFYSNIGSIRSSEVAYGSLNVPPSADLTIIENAGITWTENDNTPSVKAVVGSIVSIIIQLIGHGVDLDYSYTRGQKDYIIKVTNTGVVQDTFNLTIESTPMFTDAELNQSQVTLNSGQTAHVKLTVTSLPHPLITPAASCAITGFMEDVLSSSYIVKIKAVCQADETVWDMVKVPVGASTSYTVELTQGDLEANATTQHNNTVIILNGNLTVKNGASLVLNNSLIILGRNTKIKVEDQASLQFNNSGIFSADGEAEAEVSVGGVLGLNGKVFLDNSIIHILNDLEINPGTNVTITDSFIDVGNQTSTPTLTVHTGGALTLINSAMQSYDPSSPFWLRGGGKIEKHESNIRDFLSCGVFLVTSIHALHIRPGETAEYIIEVTNTGNETDIINLNLEFLSTEWDVTISPEQLLLGPRETGIAHLYVQPSTSDPAQKIIQVNVTAVSQGDTEKTDKIVTFTTLITETYPTEFLIVNNTDIFLSDKDPREGETVTLGLIVHNDGDQEATAVHVDFYDLTASELIGSSDIASIPPRSQAVATTPWSIHSDKVHEILAITTYSSGVVEASTDIVIKVNPHPLWCLKFEVDPPLTAYTGQPLIFDAFNSTDIDGYIACISWDFGDGTKAEGPIIIHSYEENGNYTVTLEVVDNDGMASTSTFEITILNRFPTAAIEANSTAIFVNETILFNANSSFDLDGEITSYMWDFGDNQTSSEASTTHSYREVGTYNVTLTVTDNDGEVSVANLTIHVLPIRQKFHDILVYNVKLDSDKIYKGNNVTVTVTIMNIGDYTENFTLALFQLDETNVTITSQNVTLNSGEIKVLSFSWVPNATGIYSLIAEISILEDEYDPTDNTYTIKMIIVYGLSAGGSSKVYLK